MYALKLRDHFKDILNARFNVMDINTVMDLPKETKDVVLVDGRNVDATEVYEYVQEHTVADIIYIVDHQSGSISAMAKAIGMELLPEDKFLKWCEERNPITKAPVLTFWGVLPQYGTTTLTTAVATYLQQEYDVNVGVLGLNLYDPGDWVLENPTRYLDDMITFLQAKKLKPEEMPGLMDRFDKSGVYHLFGNRNQAVALQYSLSDIQHLIDTAAEQYDVVVIDAGSILNTAAAVQSLVSAGTLYAVITDRLYAQQRLNQQFQQVLRPLGIDTSEVLLVGNAMNKPKSLSSFARATGTVPIASIPDIKQTALLSEDSSDRLKFVLEEKSVKRELKKIAASVAETYGLTSKQAIR